MPRLRISHLPLWVGLLAPFGLLGLFNGCFTEVGNPGDDMVAVLRVASSGEDSTGAGAPDSVDVRVLFLRSLGAEVFLGAREETLWGSERPVNVAGGDSLPRARMTLGDADSMHLMLAAPTGNVALNPDSIDWETFSAPGYVAGRYARGGNWRRFVMALPDTAVFTLRYSRAALEAWHYANHYRCLVLFRPRYWMKVPGLDSARLHPDRNGDSVVFFDATHNAALHAALLKRFGKAFENAKAYGDPAYKYPGAPYRP